MAINKKPNEYQQALAPKVYRRIPKAVFAAIAVSSLTSGGESLQEATTLVIAEWETLWENGIVPQEPPKRWQR